VTSGLTGSALAAYSVLAVLFWLLTLLQAAFHWRYSRGPHRETKVGAMHTAKLFVHT